MKYILIVLSILITSVSFCQNSILSGVKNRSGNTTMPEKNRTYVNANLKPVAKSIATYYLVKKFIQKNRKIDWVPNYEGYPMAHVTPMGISSYIFNYYHLNHKLSFSAAVYVNDQNENDYEFSGPAEWYNKDGSLLAKGNLVGGALHGIYTEYNKYGKISSKKRYVRGKEFTMRIHEPLLGEWLCVTENYQGKNKEYYNYNTFYKNGTVVINSYVLNHTKYSTYKTYESSTTRLWKYTSNQDGSGTLLTYNPEDGKLVENDKLMIQNRYLISHVVEHTAKELIGQKSIFKKKSR